MKRTTTKRAHRKPAPPTMREAADLMADALAGDAAITPAQRALYNAVHDALCAANGLAGGSNPASARQALNDAADRIVVNAMTVRQKTTRTANVQRHEERT